MSTRTPIRALPSTLTSPSSSNFPPYSELNKVAHGRIASRLSSEVQVRWFALGAFIVFIWSSGVEHVGWGKMLLLWIVMINSCVGIVGWNRISRVRTRRTLKPSPSATFKAAVTTRRTETLSILAAFSASSLIILACYLFVSQDVPLFVKSRKHPYYINPHLVWLVLSQLSLSVLMTVRVLSLDSWLWPFLSSPLLQSVVDPTSGSKPKKGWVGTYVLPIIPSLLLPIPTIPVAFAFLFVLRAFALPVLSYIPFLSSIIYKPFLAHFLLRRSPYTFSLIFRPSSWLIAYRAFVIGAWTAWIWEIGTWGVCDRIFVGPQSEVVGDVKGAIGALVEGEKEKKEGQGYGDIVQWFALTTLLSASKEEKSAAREVIYTSPALWSSLTRTLLLLLGRDYQLLLHRGTLPPPAAAPAAAAPAPAPAPPGTPLKPLPSASIYKPSPTKNKGSPFRNILNSVLSDEGDINRAAEEVGDVVSANDKVPEVFGSLSQSVFKEVAAVVPKPPVVAPGSAAGGVLSVVKDGKLPASLQIKVDAVKGWWTRARVHKRVDGEMLGAREKDYVIVSILANLVSHSLKEDTFGTVQRDIPKIVEALLRYLAALEDLGAELEPKPDTDSDWEVEEKIRGREIVSQAESVLKSNISLIVSTFGTKLGAYKWPVGMVGERVKEWVRAFAI